MPLYSNYRRHQTEADRQKYIASSVNYIASIAKWVFIDGTDIPTIKGACVYFAYDSDYPELTKIGFTTKLKARVKQLNYEYVIGDPRICLRAVAKASREFELALHHHFQEERQAGEWFSTAPVMAWLTQIREKLAVNRD